MSDTLYLDYNAHKPPTQQILQEMVWWSVKGNPSSAYAGAADCNDLIKTFKEELSIVYDYPLNAYTIIFTSGASESNSHIITSTCRAFIRKKNVRPHVIISNIEHDSINYAAEDLSKDNITFEKTPVGDYGSTFCIVSPEQINRSIRQNTCLISVMYANNETGSINNINKIGEYAAAKGIPFHSDAVQFAPRGTFKPLQDKLCAFSLSFHKIGGPIGCGLLAIRNDFLEGYGLSAIIYGSQQGKLRGGTIPIALIAASRAAFITHYDSKRLMLNANMPVLKSYLINKLSTTFKTFYVDAYKNNNGSTDQCIVLLTAPNVPCLSNTLLLSAYAPVSATDKRNKYCNIELRKALMASNIIVSIGSACKTGAKEASHILGAINLPQELYRGVLRISMGDSTSESVIDYFINTLRIILQNY